MGRVAKGGLVIDNRGWKANRWLAAVAAVLMAVGVFMFTAGAASASPTKLVTRPHSHPVIRFSSASQSVSLTVPTPACAGGVSSCQWMLYVNEPAVPGRTVVGVVTGVSGTLTVAYPSNFCGVLQADALIGPAPWKLVSGHRAAIQTVQPCPPSTTTTSTTTTSTTTTSTTTTTMAPPQTQATSGLPFSDSTTTSTVAALTAATSSGSGKNGTTAALAQLPFTGVNITPLALLGIALILIGLVVLTTVEQRRRALRRAAITVRTGPVGDYSGRTSRWFLGE